MHALPYTTSILSALRRYAPFLLLPILVAGGVLLYQWRQDDRLEELREIWLADSLGCGMRSVETTKEMLEGFGLKGRSQRAVIRMLGEPRTQYVDMSNSAHPVRRLVYGITGGCADVGTRIESAGPSEATCILEIAIDLDSRRASGYQIRCE
jgi:hypothetical protein